MVERIKLTPAPASSDGRFGVGNQAARGNKGPAMKRARYRFRSALLHLLTVADEKSGEPNFVAGARRMIKEMINGNVQAGKLVFDHSMGAPLAQVEVAKIEGEYLDEIPEPHLGMSLKELTNNYNRMLRARPRPPDESDPDSADVVNVVPLEPEMTPEQSANLYLQSLEQAGRRIRDDD
jgi:hypothetical protein